MNKSRETKPFDLKVPRSTITVSYKDINETKIKSQKKHVDSNNKELNGKETQNVKSIQETKTNKKAKTGPKKTGWWSQ